MLATDRTRCSWRRSCHTDQRKCKAMGHFTLLSLSARSLKCGTSEREWGSTASTPSRNGLFIPRLKVKGSQTTAHAKRWWRNSELPTNYWRHWPYKRALLSRLRRKRWKWKTTNIFNHKLWRSGKQVQPAPSSPKCWPFLCGGKHADDEWRAFADNWQFPRLSSDHQLPA